jgi:hypothetical protein
MYLSHSLAFGKGTTKGFLTSTHIFPVFPERNIGIPCRLNLPENFADTLKIIGERRADSQRLLRFRMQELNLSRVQRLAV